MKSKTLFLLNLRFSYSFFIGQGPPYDLTVDICALLVLIFEKHDSQKINPRIMSILLFYSDLYYSH